jgi:hypothetical protein
MLATPSKEHCCVVACGQGYLVNVPNPDQTVTLPDGGGIVAAVGSSRLLVLVTFTELLGILPEGRWWRSERLASDGIRNVVVSEDTVTGEAWQAHGDRWVGFRIDAQTGKARK